MDDSDIQLEKNSIASETGISEGFEEIDFNENIFLDNVNQQYRSDDVIELHVHISKNFLVYRAQQASLQSFEDVVAFDHVAIFPVESDKFADRVAAFSMENSEKLQCTKCKSNTKVVEGHSTTDYSHYCYLVKMDLSTIDKIPDTCQVVYHTEKEEIFSISYPFSLQKNENKQVETTQIGDFSTYEDDENNLTIIKTKYNLLEDDMEIANEEISTLKFEGATLLDLYNETKIQRDEEKTQHSDLKKKYELVCDEKKKSELQLLDKISKLDEERWRVAEIKKEMSAKQSMHFHESKTVYAQLDQSKNIQHGLQEEVTLLKSTIMVMNDKLEEYEATTNATAKAHLDLKIDVIHKDETIKTLSLNLEEQETSFSAIIEALEKKEIKNKECIAKLESQLDNVRNEIASSESKQNALEYNNKLMEKALTTLSEKHQSLRKESKAMEEEIILSKTEMARISNNKIDLLEKFNEERKGLMGKIESSKINSAQYLNDLNEARTRILNMQNTNARLVGLNKVFTSLKSQHNELKKMYDSSVNEIKNLKAEISAMTDKSNEVKILKLEILSLRKQNAEKGIFQSSANQKLNDNFDEDAYYMELMIEEKAAREDEVKATLRQWNEKATNGNDC
ncbi:hypothetical protein A3Q56_02608 [Intoshia linei]|uniref:Uncharacterized protein n=1 Tax=Intoshia linei TaxID=1819745 RepID=A0A177B894_9BILA|nr:hypothetical protein A3Q56_02608 [Intoshia linei]